MAEAKNRKIGTLQSGENVKSGAKLDGGFVLVTYPPYRRFDPPFSDFARNVRRNKIVSGFFKSRRDDEEREKILPPAKPLMPKLPGTEGPMWVKKPVESVLQAAGQTRRDARQGKAILASNGKFFKVPPSSAWAKVEDVDPRRRTVFGLGRWWDCQSPDEVMERAAARLRSLLARQGSSKPLAEPQGLGGR
jgi:hypothetical protein